MGILRGLAQGSSYQSRADYQDQTRVISSVVVDDLENILFQQPSLKVF